MNLYTYSHNNPISYYDPTGHSVLSVLTAFKAAKTVVKAIVKPELEKKSKSVKSFTSGVGVSAAKNNIVEPVMLASSISNIIELPFFGLGVEKSRKERESLNTFENIIRENLVPDKKSYDTGRVLGDAITTVQGAFECTAGIFSMIGGSGLMALGGGVTVLSGGVAALPGTAISTAGVSVTAAGVAATAHGASTTFFSAKNMKQNKENLRQSTAESKANKSKTSTSNVSGISVYVES